MAEEDMVEELSSIACGQLILKSGTNEQSDVFMKRYAGSGKTAPIQNYISERKYMSMNIWVKGPLLMLTLLNIGAFKWFLIATFGTWQAVLCTCQVAEIILL